MATRRFDSLVSSIDYLHMVQWLSRVFLAAQNLVPYSEKEPAIFKTNQLTPIKDLKLLIRDYAVLFPPSA